MKIKLEPTAFVPRRAHSTDAGLDLLSRWHTIIPAHGSAEFDTGVHIGLPHGYYGKIESKSGLNVNYDIVSCGGVIDEGYTGSIVVKLYNFSEKDYVVETGDKVAQLIIQPYIAPKLEFVDSLEETDRGDNGFGSTGK